MYFRCITIISPLERAWPYLWSNWNSLYRRIIWAKFAWHWHYLFQKWLLMIVNILSLYIHLEQCVYPSLEWFRIFIIKGFVQSLIIIDLVVLKKKKMKMCKVYKQTDGRRETNDKKNSLKRWAEKCKTHSKKIC